MTPLQYLIVQSIVDHKLFSLSLVNADYYLENAAAAAADDDNNNDDDGGTSLARTAINYNFLESLKPSFTHSFGVI